MVAYRVDLPGGAHEVTAMFRGRASEEPRRVVMRLEGQDEVQFSMPDEPQTLYTFASMGNAVEISAEACVHAGRVEISRKPRHVRPHVLS